MGSTDNKEESGLVDCSVGSIVWVRRRNGSWWPGKILGAEELSAAHLMSPRSGTPVKLLGREDASVDWYNLEKSKRVKAFRCGEFDDCIERAESSLGMPPKKREKYARREDAILHALELEKQLLENKYGILGSSVNCNSSKSCDAVKKELMTSSECSSYDNSKDVNLKPDSEKHDAFLEDKSINNPVCPTNTNEASQPEGDEDNSELLPRMRGLQDFGLKTGLSKQKLSSSISLNGSRKPELDNIAHDLPSSGFSKVNTSSLDIRSSLEKKRKSHEVMTDDILVKRRDRRRPLLQVLQSSEKLPSKSTLQLDSTSVSTHMSGEEQAGLTHHAKRSNLYLPGESTTCSDDDKLVCSDQMARSPSQLDRDDFHHPTPSNEESASESSESTETDSSETDSVDSDGDEEMVDLSDPALITGLEPKSLGISGQVRHGSMTSKFHNYSALESDASHLHSHDTVSASLGVSKWQLKGKRNNRSLARRSTEVTDRWVSRGSMYGTELEYVESDGFDENDIIERNFRNRRRPFHKASSKGLDDVTHNIIDWEDLAWNDQTYMRGYWEDSSNYLDPMLGGHQFGGRMRPRLVDVDLKVQSSYQREHVPMISLMSKINGQAIVGHPIQIEALENGSSDILLSEADGISPEILDNDTALPAVWRTARRTANFRVPRSHPSATLEGEESTEHFQDMDQLKKMPSKRSNVGNFGHRPSMMKKGLSHGSRPMDRKFSRKPSKKISLSSNQKIKNLSAIGKEQKFGNDFRNGSKNSFQVGGLIKGEPGPTAVACIPVKLVYSRLNEELVGRHQ